jgi:hypothetical protein
MTANSEVTLNRREQAKPLIDSRLRAIVVMTPEKRPSVQE